MKKELEKLNIKEMYQKFPKNYINDVNGWAFNKQFLNNNLGKLLTMDIDFGINCSLNCPHCFRRDNLVDINNNYLTYNEIMKYILEAKKLGLKSVKFLGKGEPFEEKKLIDFLEFLNNEEIIPLIFTKGHVLGDDELAKKYYKHKNIHNSEQLIRKLYDLNASILLGFNSYKTSVQDKMVGNIKGYTEKRNKALKTLARFGFNKTNPTRLCLATNPITNQNYNEIFDIYEWARLRNIYVIVTPSMISGRAEKNEFWRNITPNADKLVSLYYKIYKFNLDHGLQTIDQICEEGISGYSGGHPCNQISCGMYITLNGEVLRCPGDDITRFGNIKKTSLKEIWFKSQNYGRSGCFNCGCPPKWGKSIPYNLFTDVLIKLKKYFKKKKV